MRIIAGKFKGRTLNSPKDKRVRPTCDRIKETMFNILCNRYGFEGENVLDLFCGSGALGMEAYSRGAKDVTFVDASADSVVLTKENLKKCGMGDLLNNVFHADFSLAIKKLSGKSFKLILLDPPYHIGIHDKVLGLIKEYDLLETDGVVCFEHASNINFSQNDSFLVDTRIYGNTALSFFIRSDVHNTN